MRTILLLLATLPFLASCSDKTGMLTAQLESQREKASSLEAELEKTRAGAEAQKKEWESGLLTCQGTISNLEAAVAAKDQQIMELNQALATARAPRKVKSPALPTIGAPLRTSTTASAAPARAASMEFPVRVFDVLGRKVVTGQRTEKVERERHIFSDRGKYVFRGKSVLEDPYVTKTIKEYGYEITFSVRGLAHEPSTVQATAGDGQQTITVTYDQLQKGTISTRTRADKLLVTVGERQQEHTVSW